MMAGFKPKRRLYPIFIIYFLSTAFAIAGTSGEGYLTVIVTGAENDNGYILLALSNSPENYRNHTEPFRTAITEVSNKGARFNFPGLPFGEYAVKVFHDENANKDLDTNFLGIPKENYGFSNNVRGKFGPPDWKKAFFQFHADSLVININLK
ncbi:MAG: DUF2141 domain-containing protein [Calditrichia bacterium]